MSGLITHMTLIYLKCLFTCPIFLSSLLFESSLLNSCLSQSLHIFFLATSDFHPSISPLLSSPLLSSPLRSSPLLSSLQALSGDSAVNPSLGRLVLQCLCPALHSLLTDGLKPHQSDLIAGRRPNSTWGLVQATTKPGSTPKIKGSEIKKQMSSFLWDSAARLIMVISSVFCLSLFFPHINQCLLILLSERLWKVSQQDEDIDWLLSAKPHNNFSLTTVSSFSLSPSPSPSLLYSSCQSIFKGPKTQALYNLQVRVGELPQLKRSKQRFNAFLLGLLK